MNTRSDLAAVFTGYGVELGVAAGAYSAQILANPSVARLYSVDRWSDHHDEAEYQAARRLLTEFGDRSVIVRSTFRDALHFFPDDTLDFVYIDGYAHEGQENGATLDLWWPKLKSGGIFAGHDYAAQYPKTVEVVNCFSQRKDCPLKVTVADSLPSWIIVRP